MHAGNKFTRAWSLSQPGHWLGPVTRFELLGPAQPHGPSWAQPKKIQKLFQKIYDFPVYFSTEFCLVLVCIFIPWRYKFGIKIPSFHQNIEIYIFMHTSKSLKNKKSYCIFIQQRTIQKYVLACILALITSLLKSRELGQYFQNSKKNYLIFY
jgi:hypothetical protein